MLEIQKQPQVQAKPAVSFKGESEYYARPSFDDVPDSFDRDAIDAERDEKLDKINESRQGFDDLADELEKTDNPLAKKASKGVRVLASILGLVGTFVVAKYSSKVAIETLKTAAKNPLVQGTIEKAKGMQGPAKKAFDSVKALAGKIAKNPKVKEGVDKIAGSKIGKFATEAVKNEKVAKILEPLKETVKSVKNIKINGKSIQSAIENTMAATTTGSVLVDNLAGRNNDKSVVDLATGV